VIAVVLSAPAGDPIAMNGRPPRRATTGPPPLPARPGRGSTGTLGSWCMTLRPGVTTPDPLPLL